MSSIIVTDNKSVQAVRGTTIEPARLYAERSRGTPAWATFIAALNDDQRQLFEQPISRRDWYDLRVYAEFIELAANTLGGDDPERYLHHAGRYVFDYGVNLWQRAFFRIASPTLVIRGSAMLWGLFFRGTKLIVTSRERRRVSVILRGGDFCSRPLCVSIGGGMFRALERGGARDVVIEHHVCRSERGPDCEFRFSWR